MLKQFALGNKSVLVTGASSGIGRQVALSISEAGGTVYITGRDEDRLKKTFQSLSGKGHQFIVADLTADAELKKLVDALPMLDGIVHAAGITSHFPAKFIGAKQISETFDINLGAVMLLMKGILSRKILNDSSSLVFLSSIAVKYPYFGGSLYSASKQALEGYCRTLALELSSKKIRANCLAPAMVQTPMLEKTEETISKETLDKFQSVHPLGFGKPEDVANAAVFMLSDASRWITGQRIILGGL